MSKKQSKSPPYPRRWPPLRGLQARMTFSYVGMTTALVQWQMFLEVLKSFSLYYSVKHRSMYLLSRVRL